MTNANTTPANGSTTTKQHRLKVKRGWYDYQGRQTRQQQSIIAEFD